MTSESADPTPASTLRAATTASGLATEEPVGRSTGWWGMTLFIATEATLVASFLGTYFYLRFQSGSPWPPAGIETPDLFRPLIMTGLLLISSVPLVWAERASRTDRRGEALAGLAVTLLLTAAFLTVQGLEYAGQLDQFTITTNAYGGLFYGITGLHAGHVSVGLLLLAWLLAATVREDSAAGRHERIRLALLYWYFLDVVWVAVLFTVYLSPRL